MLLVLQNLGFVSVYLIDQIIVKRTLNNETFA